MATEADLAAYVASVRGQYIDVDRVFGAQCWDQWSHYAQWYGVPAWPTYTNAGGTQPHSGFACNVWHNFERSGLAQWFEKIPAGQGLRPGDVVIWEFGSAWYPLSHIATLLEVLANGMLRCLTQNPGAVQIADLIPRGVLGALRPKALTVGALNTKKSPTLTASQKQRSEEDDMAKRVGLFYTDTDTKHIVYVIADTSSGFYKTSSARKPGVPMDTPQLQRWAIAYELGGGGFMETTQYEARDLEQACAKVRAGRA